MNREIQDKKSKLLRKISDLLKQIKETKNPNMQADLQSKANSLLVELKLLDAPSAPTNNLSSNKTNTNTNTLEERLRNIREKNYQHGLVTDRLSSGLKELRQTVAANSNSNSSATASASAPSKPTTFMGRLTQIFTGENKLPDNFQIEGKSSDEEIDMEKALEDVGTGDAFLLAQEFKTPEHYTGLTHEEEEMLANLGGGKRKRKTNKRKTNKKRINKKKKYSKKRRASRRK